MARTELFVRKQSGGMFSVVNQALTTGNIFFVNSANGTNSASYGQNPDAPTATLAYAIGLCTANQGDRIYVMPGHTEAIAGCNLLRRGDRRRAGDRPWRGFRPPDHHAWHGEHGDGRRSRLTTSASRT
jgi:hypothetical protein